MGETKFNSGSGILSLGKTPVFTMHARGRKDAWLPKWMSSKPDSELWTYLCLLELLFSGIQFGKCFNPNGVQYTKLLRLGLSIAAYSGKTQAEAYF